MQALPWHLSKLRPSGQADESSLTGGFELHDYGWAGPTAGTCSPSYSNEASRRHLSTGSWLWQFEMSFLIYAAILRASWPHGGV